MTRSLTTSDRYSKLDLVEDTVTMALPNNILVQILEILYADFLASDIDIEEHHCSLLYPCIPVSKSTNFKSIYTFRLISSNWNNVFLTTAELDRYASHRIVQDPLKHHSSTRFYGRLRKSVVLRRYRVFRNLDTEHGFRGVVVAYDFGVAGGCKKSRQVIIKAWMNDSDEDYETEKKVYDILSASPMKGCPSLIESTMDPNRSIYALVLEKLGPSLEDLCNLMSPNVRFDEQMSLALAIQMVRKMSLLTGLNLLLIS